jgi:Cdc6-like AAA superfamily ATPase
MGPKFEEELKECLNIMSNAMKSPTKIQKAVTPTAERRPYSLIIGKYGTGKTTLVRLAINELKEPKGVVYFSVPMTNPPIDLVGAMLEALGWYPDPVIDSGKCKYCSYFQFSIT